MECLKIVTVTPFFQMVGPFFQMVRRIGETKCPKIVMVTPFCEMIGSFFQTVGSFFQMVGKIGETKCPRSITVDSRGETDSLFFLTSRLARRLGKEKNCTACRVFVGGILEKHTLRKIFILQIITDVTHSAKFLPSSFLLDKKRSKPVPTSGGKSQD